MEKKFIALLLIWLVHLALSTHLRKSDLVTYSFVPGPYLTNDNYVAAGSSLTRNNVSTVPLDGTTNNNNNHGGTITNNNN